MSTINKFLLIFGIGMFVVVIIRYLLASPAQRNHVPDDYFQRRFQNKFTSSLIVVIIIILVLILYPYLS